MVAALCFVGTYAYLRRLAAKGGGKALRGKRPSGPVNFLTSKWIFAILAIMLGFQIYLNAIGYLAFVNNFPNLTMFVLGEVLLLFAAMFQSNFARIFSLSVLLMYPSYGPGS